MKKLFDVVKNKKNGLLLMQKTMPCIRLAVALLFVWVFLFACSVSVRAEDIYDKIINGDPEQSAFVLAEIESVDSGMDVDAQVRIIRCINGSVEAYHTSVYNIDNSDNDLKAGDTIVVSLKRRFFGGYDVSLIIKKVLINDMGVVEMAKKEYTPDLFALEWYVNTGQKQFVFSSNKKNTAFRLFAKDDTSEYINDDNQVELDLNDVSKTLLYEQKADGTVYMKKIEKPFLTTSNNVLITEKFYVTYRIQLIIGLSVFLVVIIVIWPLLYKWAKKKKTKSEYNYMEDYTDDIQ